MAHPLITPIKSPSEEVLAAYNCIEFCFLITDNITVAGSEAFLDLQVDNPLVNGDSFIIFGQQFYVTPAVNDNGHNIAVGADENEQRNFIFDTMSTNYEITKQFDVAKVGNENITFTAKKNGVDYGTDFSTTNTDLQQITEDAGVDTEVRNAYKVIGCIEVKQNGEWVVFDEEVRDVVLKLDDDGNLTSEVCYRLHGMLRNYFINKRYDLDSVDSFINDGAVFEFRLSIVDFKSTTGQVGVSGYFDTGDTSYTVLNGMHKLQDNDIKLLPYYDKSLNGFIKSLNQIPLTNYACCDNNGFMALLVLDKEMQGWGVQLIGDVNFEGGGIESNFNYGGFSGVGTAVVVIPIGPRQLEICDNFLGLGKVINYTYQGVVFNSATGNLFVDGDNGTFETSIVGVTPLVGTLAAQTQNGYILNGLQITEFFNATLNPINTVLLFGSTSMLFEVGNIYFLEAWVKVEGILCECLFNMFTDGELGTFDGPNPLDVINIISGATSSIVLGFENNSLRIVDLDSSTLQHLSYLMDGDTGMFLVNNRSYELTAWVKVDGVDCLNCIDINLFIDGNNGTFDSPNPLLGIIALVGISAVQDSGYLGTDGLLLETLHLAAIINGSQLFRGDTNINFFAGVTYEVTMYMRVEQFDCDILGNLFTDGDFGRFDGGAALGGIVPLAGITTSIDSGTSGTDGLMLSTLHLASVVPNAQLFRGDTNINFIAGETYTVTMAVKASDINCNLINNLFLDGDNGTFEADIIGMSSPTPNILLNHQLGGGRLGGNSILIDNAVPLLLGVNAVLLRGDTSMNIQAGKTYEITGWIDLEGDALINACLDPTGLELGIKVASTLGIGDITLLGTTTAVYNSSTCGSNPTWIEVTYLFTANINLSIIMGYHIVGGPSFLEPVGQEISFDDMSIVEITGGTQDVRFNAGLTVPIGANGTEVIDTELILDNSCSLLDTWVTVQTTITATNNFTGKIALITTGVSGVLAYAETRIRIDDVSVVAATPAEIKFHAGLTVPIGANGTEVIDSELVLETTCSQLDEWVQIKTTLNVTNNFTGKVALITTGQSNLLANDQTIIRADFVEVKSLFDGTILRMNAGTLFGGTTQSFDSVIDLGTDCSQLNEWVQLKTTFVTPTFGSATVKAGIQALGNVQCLKQAGVEILVDNIVMKEVGNDGMNIYINTAGATILTTARIDDCDKIGEWIKITSSFTPTVTVNDTVGISLTDNLVCLNANDAKITVDEIKVRCHSLDAAAITELQTVVIQGDCDGCQDDCCCNSEFTYRNELGQFDMIHLECIKEELLVVSKTDVEICQDCDDDISEAGSKVSSAKSNTRFSINARIIKERSEQFKVFLASIEIYHVVDNKLYPVKILNGDLAIKQKVKTFIDVDLEFEYRFENPTLIA